jgi:hypothetical protein
MNLWRPLIALIFSFSVVHCYSQHDEDRADRAAGSALQALGVNHAGSSQVQIVGGPGRQTLAVAKGRWLVAVDPSTYRVTSISGGESLSSAKTGKPAFVSEQAAVDAARAVGSSLGWELPSSYSIDSPKISADGLVRETRVWVVFFERPAGYDSTNSGPRVGVAFNSLTGEVVSAYRKAGGPRLSADLQVTVEEASEIAERAGAGVVKKVFGPKWLDMNRHDSLSERGKALLEKKASLLCYWIDGSKKYMTVDATTGEVLSSGKAGLADGSMVTDPQGRTSWQWAGACAAVACLGLLLARQFARAKASR